MLLYLGTHIPSWLALAGPALMVSLNTLAKRPRVRAAVPWFLDSGGFTELQRHGRWTTTPEQHAERCAEVVELVGNVNYVSPQDYMCEPAVVQGGSFKGLTFAGTNKTVAEHQELTVQNYLDLVRIAPHVPWLPVLQGWEVDDYHRCADMYEQAGVSLAAAPLVGVGSMCRREALPEAGDILRTLAAKELKLHAFGFKQQGIRQWGQYLSSADSMAWSFNARHEGRKWGRTCGRPSARGGTVTHCGNCRHYAVDWHTRTTELVP